ncbi:MAG: CPBP family intramembrane metalloprotease [Candidatus Rokubacteria bacterium]|nr:CPBP family intramembrane metalloprotease [Candidatus Rokubacteria bacterium]
MPEPTAPHELRLSAGVSVLAAFVLLAYIAWITWTQASVPPLDRVSSPEQALLLMVSRAMDLEEALAQAPRWERRLYEVTTGGIDEPAQAIAWYEELAAYSSDPLAHFHLAILEAEAGRLDRIRLRTDGWEHRPEPFPTFLRVIRAGYLGSHLDHDGALLLQRELAELVPTGWFYDRLTMRLATQSGNHALLAATREGLAARAGLLLGRYRLLAAIDLAWLLAGILALFAVFTRHGRDLKVGTPPIPPRWRARVAVAVLLRGGAIAAVLTISADFIRVESPLLRLVVTPVINLPLLILAYRHLLAPSGLGFRQGLGLWPAAADWHRLGVIVPVVLAAALVGEWVIGLAAGSVDLSSHWTEGFDEELVWGSMPVLAVSFIDDVVFAPVFEEIVFRGLLFATLRRKFGWRTSAAASAVVFALAHEYGVLELASVFWSGILWAWAYEKTGSLLPGMVAHAVNNLVVFVSVIVLLRLA